MSDASRPNPDLSARVESRVEANAFFELMQEEAERQPCQYSFYERMFIRLKTEIGGYGPSKPKPKPTALEPMTREEAWAFEKTEMPFGQFNGVKVIHVPVGYLLWVADSSFAKELSRYLRSSVGQERQS